MKNKCYSLSVDIIDEEKRSNHLLLMDIWYKSIGIVAQNGEWGIETISGLPVLVGKECLNFVTPYEEIRIQFVK